MIYPETIFAIAFTIVFFLHEKFRIKDEQVADITISNHLKKLWHRYKGGVQLVVFLYVGFSVYERSRSLLLTVGLTLFVASFYWMFHDGLLNVSLFKKGWWYVGTTGKIDRSFGVTIVSILKVVTLLLSLIILWICHKTS